MSAAGGEWVWQPTEALDLTGVPYDPATNPYAVLFADQAMALWRSAKPGETPGQLTPQAGCACPVGRHAIGCLVTAATQPHAMINDAGEVFYPDNPPDALLFAHGHDARFLNAAAGAAWLTEQEDPAPTTGGPVEFYRPEGCVCHLREDPEWGEVFTAPPEGCRVHTPWAFPGYTLDQETAQR